jgi:hypothetical protein
LYVQEKLIIDYNELSLDVIFNIATIIGTDKSDYVKIEFGNLTLYLQDGDDVVEVNST